MMELIVIRDGMSLALDRAQERTMYDERTGDRSMEWPASRDTRLTYDDFVLFPDDGMRHEIIDGEHYVTPSPGVRHQMLVGRLHFEIESWVRQHSRAGQVFLSPLDVLFTRWDIVEPDLSFVTPDQEEILTDKNVQGPPALVIEIASPGTRKRDEGIKLQLFDRGGVGSTGSSIQSAIASPSDGARRMALSHPSPSCHENGTTCSARRCWPS